MIDRPTSNSTNRKRVRVLLTGATGAIGMALLPELLDLGFIVYCLVRSRPGQSAEHRLRTVTSHPNAIAIDGDITKPLGGIDLTRLPPIDKFVHAAADTSLHHACGANVLAMSDLLDEIAAACRERG